MLPVLRACARLSPRATRLNLIKRGGGEHPINEPGGYLFGEKPLAAGEKRVKEDWETIWVWGWSAFFVIGAVGWIYKPDNSLSTWAYNEAKRRLEADGVNLDYEKTPICTDYLPKPKA
ncbi:hypothetical protein CONCODRAFT_56354 [Conidiobolus coronatus NRRL 28638]|uniref:NADH dehydrogenase [ubiquinone] 1 beta subcomplex subunit 11, mitochondrial n=1 Tax=Conidiobolus coronatus (strain ATCC 28846 / CBS 209.66 / NRRL 28638) TaxID=796925 RepID=A0A137PBP7_CONC2|nr:hypothetical protein CONCODRAFT_56354 [Conidiobolus coronatus NRRL 28638]|eukprot:KXN72415.1 hypothetical protein CONCODRAFT_56354 [Conidiobolus coronatus NRRL 28638]